MKRINITIPDDLLVKVQEDSKNGSTSAKISRILDIHYSHKEHIPLINDLIGRVNTLEKEMERSKAKAGKTNIKQWIEKNHDRLIKALKEDNKGATIINIYKNEVTPSPSPKQKEEILSFWDSVKDSL